MKIKAALKRFKLDYILYILLALTGISMIWIKICSPHQELGFDKETAVELSAVWEISWGEQKTEAVLPTTIQNPNGDKIIMRTILQEAGPYGNSILFYSRQSRVVVSVDGIQLWDSGDAVTKPFRFSYGSFWNAVRLPEQWIGSELCIEMTPQFSAATVANQLPAVFLGTKASFIYKVLKDGLFNIAFCIIVFILGVYDMLSGMFHIHRRKSKQIFFLGAFAVCLSIWMMLESRVIQLASGNLALNTQILYLSFELMPILAVRFFLSYENIAKQKYMRIIYGLGLVLFAGMNLVTMCGLCYIFEIQFLVQIYAVIALAGLFFYALISRKEAKPAYEKRLYYSICILLASTVLELLYFCLISPEKSGMMLRLGLGVFICYLGLSIIKEGRLLREDDMERQMLSAMAYTDGLTHMKNRFAFEEEMERLRGQSDGQAAILIADINSLKAINDNFGHTQGDDAIRQVADALQKTFEDVASCYRIGGDEFCAIAVSFNAAQLEKRRDIFEKEVTTRTTEYPLEVSVGISAGGAKDIDNTFRQADERMYVRKSEMKEKLEK